MYFIIPPPPAPFMTLIFVLVLVAQSVIANRECMWCSLLHGYFSCFTGLWWVSINVSIIFEWFLTFRRLMLMFTSEVSPSRPVIIIYLWGFALKVVIVIYLWVFPLKVFIYLWGFAQGCYHYLPSRFRPQGCYHYLPSRFRPQGCYHYLPSRFRPQGC